MANKEGQRNRVDDSEINNRVFYISKLILQGYSKRSFLLEKITSDNNWNVSERQIDNYIKKAKDLIKNSYTKEDLVIEKDIALNRLEALFSMNMKIQDYREARNVTMDRMKLLGELHDKVDHTSSDGSMSPKESIDYSKVSSETLKKFREEAENEDKS